MAGGGATPTLFWVLGKCSAYQNSSTASMTTTRARFEVQSGWPVFGCVLDLARHPQNKKERSNVAAKRRKHKARARHPHAHLGDPLGDTTRDSVPLLILHIRTKRLFFPQCGLRRYTVGVLFA
jgi:hypothetical protein